VGEGVAIADLKRELGPRRALMGNFDPLLLRDASPEVVAAETEKMVRQMARGTGHGAQSPDSVRHAPCSVLFEA